MLEPEPEPEPPTPPPLELQLQRLLEERLAACRRLALCHDGLHDARLRLHTGCSELRLAATALTDLPEEVAPFILAQLDPVSVARLSCTCRLLWDLVRRLLPPARLPQAISQPR